MIASTLLDQTQIRPRDYPRDIADITARDILLTVINRPKQKTRNVAIVYQVHKLLCQYGRRLSREQLNSINGLKPSEIDRLLAALELARWYERRVV